MIDLKIKITGIGCWDDAVPLEFTFEEAAKLYEELRKVFENRAMWISPSESVNKNGHRFSCMCSECARNNVLPL